MENNHDFLTYEMLNDQELYASLFMNSDTAIKGNDEYEHFSYDDKQNIDNMKSPQTKKLGRKVIVDENEAKKKRRKEQNRAAQRAFRERKERHVKELEKRFKQFEDKHTQAIQQLIQENQYLRSVICRLEVENCVLKGTPVEAIQDVSKALDNARAVLPLPPPPSTSAFQISYKTPPPPLQIRPSFMEQQIKTKAKKHTEAVQDKSKRDFTFSISTPDTLRAHSKVESTSNNFPSVQLYPDHSHPVHLMRKNKLKNESQMTPVHEQNNENDLEAFLKPFLATHKEINKNGTIGRTIEVQPVKKQTKHHQKTTSKIWQRVSEHASNPKFRVDQLLDAVKKSAMLTSERVVLDEWDMEQMLEDP